MCFQTGFSGNVIVISVFYFGGLMMLESNMTVGDLSSFLLYATYVGVALGGEWLSIFFFISLIVLYYIK